MVVWYSGPGQYNNHSNGLESDMEEDNQALVNLERNIANLERSLSTSQLGKGDLSSILNRQVLIVVRSFSYLHLVMHNKKYVNVSSFHLQHGSNQSLDTVGNNRGPGHQRSKYHTTSETQADRRKRYHTTKWISEQHQ